MLGRHFCSFYNGVVVAKFRTGMVCGSPLTLFLLLAAKDKCPEFSKKLFQILKYLKLLSL